MDRLLAALAVAATVGCSSSGPTRFVAGTAVLSAVSSDQTYVAILANPTRLSTGAHVGQLEAVPTSGQLPTTLDPMSAGGVTARGNALWYLGGVTVVNEGSPAIPRVYGTLYLWTSTLGAPIKIADNVREFYVSQNGSTCVFMQWKDKSIAATNVGTLLAVTLAGCGGPMPQCEKLAVVSDVPLAQVAWRISDDGKYVLALVRGAAATDPGKVVLLVPPTGLIETLSTGVNPRSAMISPAGDTVAWVEGANEIHVAATATAKAPATVLTTSSPIVDQAAMIDAGTFVVRTRELATGPASLQRLTAGGATVLGVGLHPVDFFVSAYVPGKTDRYVFYASAASAASGYRDLWLFDMVTPNAQPVLLGSAVDTTLSGVVGFSDDGSSIEWLDNFDPTTRRGDLYVAPLAKPVRTLVALGVHNAGFVPGTSQLLYIAAPDANSGAGVLTLLPSPSPSVATQVQTVGAVNFVDTRQPPARTWYTQLTGGHDDGVWYMQQP